MTTVTQIALPPVRVAGIDLSVRRDLQEPDGGPPDGYPYKDEPVPDAAKREPLVSHTLSMLHTHFDRRSDVMLSGDVFIYYRDENDLRRAIAPDVFVAFGPDFAQYRDRYGLSLCEVGRPPDFVMEIASPSTYRADLGYKRDAYHWMGAGEYWLLDPDDGAHYGQKLAWEQRFGREYRSMPVETDADGTVWAYSPALGLYLCAVGDTLRFYDPSAGEYLRTLEESEAALVAEQVARGMAETALAQEQAARANAETARANAETARASAETARASAETARANAETALAQEQAARADAEAQIRQMQAKLRHLREGGTPSGP